MDDRSGIQKESEPWGLLTALTPGVKDTRRDKEAGPQGVPPKRLWGLWVWRLRRCNQEERSPDD